MVFNNGDIQLWTGLYQPQAFGGGRPVAQEFFTWSWHWYRWSPGTMPGPPDYVQVTSDICNHIASSFTFVGIDSHVVSLWTSFIYWGGLWHQTQENISFTVGAYATWPSWKTIQLRRFSVGPSPRTVGRLLLSNFPKTWSSDGEFLNGFGVAQATTLCSMLDDNVTTYGGLAVPAVCSFKDGTLRDLEYLLPGQKLGVKRKRRLKPQYKPGPAFRTPRLP